MTIKPVLEFKAYDYQYPGAEEPALEGISLPVAARECICLNDPSGSGKAILLLDVKGLLKGGPLIILKFVVQGLIVDCGGIIYSGCRGAMWPVRSTVQ